MNAGIFLFCKVIFKKTGNNTIMSMMNQFTAPAPSVANPHMPMPASHTTNQRRGMRGPNINLDDIPDLSTKT